MEHSFPLFRTNVNKGTTGFAAYINSTLHAANYFISFSVRVGCPSDGVMIGKPGYNYHITSLYLFHFLKTLKAFLFLLIILFPSVGNVFLLIFANEIIVFGSNHMQNLLIIYSIDNIIRLMIELYDKKRIFFSGQKSAFK